MDGSVASQIQWKGGTSAAPTGKPRTDLPPYVTGGTLSPASGLVRWCSGVQFHYLRPFHLAPNRQKLSLPVGMGLGIDLVQVTQSWLHTLGRGRSWSEGSVGVTAIPESRSLMFSSFYEMLLLKIGPTWRALSCPWSLYSPDSWSGLRAIWL